MLNELPATDRPDDEVVQDDEECDRWFDEYTRRIAREAQEMKRMQERRGPAVGKADIKMFGG